MVAAVEPGRDDIVARLRAAGCVFAEDEAALLVEAGHSSRDLDDLITRRVGGEPLEQVLGWVEFAGLRVAVAPGVFVPRRRTELLARLAIEALASGGVLLDLCCGCGAVAAAVRASVPDIEVYAVDVDPAAVACARENLPGADVRRGDLYSPLPQELRGRVDVVVANVPYVPTEAIASMPPEARDHEPVVALDGGRDGLDIARAVATDAPRWLRRGGRLAIETSTVQAERLAAAVAASGLVAAVVQADDLDATAVVGRLP